MYLPKIAIAGLLMFLGYSNLDRWLITSSRTLSLADYLTLVAILLITIVFGFMPGIFAGLIGSCVVFVFRYGRIHPIRNTLAGSDWHSTYQRPIPEKKILQEHGAEILILKLQGYLFFGSATKIIDAIHEKMEEPGTVSIVILDFKAVTGLDSSAVVQLKKLSDQLSQENITIICCALGKDVKALIGRMGLNNVDYEHSFDESLQKAEDRLVARYRPLLEAHDDNDAWLANWLGDRELAVQLLAASEKLEVMEGDTICREGEKADGLYFIMEGLIDVQTQYADGTTILLSRIGKQTIIGEMALLEETARTASLTAHTPAVLYKLTRQKFDELRQVNPELTDLIYRNLLLDSSRRLQSANTMIRQLSM